MVDNGACFNTTHRVIFFSNPARYHDICSHGPCRERGTAERSAESPEREADIRGRFGSAGESAGAPCVTRAIFWTCRGDARAGRGMRTRDSCTTRLSCAIQGLVARGETREDEPSRKHSVKETYMRHQRMGRRDPFPILPLVPFLALAMTRLLTGPGAPVAHYRNAYLCPKCLQHYRKDHLIYSNIAAFSDLRHQRGEIRYTLV